MASRAEKRLLKAVWLTVFVAGALACDREEDVVVETVDLAEGEYSGLIWGGTQVERFHVLARKGPRNEPEDDVVLWSPQHEEPCSLGPAVRYGTLQPRTGAKFVLGAPSPARLHVYDNVDEHGVGVMSFADIDCERTGFEVADIIVGPRISLYQPDLTKLKLGLIDSRRGFLVVDPWRESSMRTDARDVGDVMFTDGGAWLIEGTQLVKRDLEGRELLRKGKSVTQLPMLLGSPDDLAYVDEGNLVVERLGTTKVIAKDVCDLNKVDAYMPGALSFYSPCDMRQLVVARPTGEPLRYKSGVTRYTAQRGQLIIVRETDAGTKLSVVFQHDPMNEREWVDLAGARVQEIWPAAGGWLVRVEVEDGTVTLLRLEERVPAGPPATVADKIVRFISEPRALAWLREDGELTMTDRDGDGVYLRAKGVSSFRFVFERRATGLAFIVGASETKLGDLRLKLLSGEAYLLARSVREYQQVWWPERGILYAQGGDDPGIRFARVDLPCEMTSDSPWACGF